jgi:hypothetical protein
VEWRSPETVERAERQVHRFIGVTFFALALYVLGQAGWTLWQQEAPSESMLGILLALASLIIMPLISWGKLQAAQVIGSASQSRSEGNAGLFVSFLYAVPRLRGECSCRLVVG